MKIEKYFNIDSLVPLLAFSNTPSYLYSKFRENTSIQFAHEYFPIEKLVEYYKNISSNIEYESIVIKYAIFVSFTFYDYIQAMEAMQSLDLSNLLWSEELKNLFVSTHNPNTNYVFYGRAQRKNLLNQKAFSNASSDVFEIEGKELSNG